MNDPKDKGGATNKGISWKTWTRYAKQDLGVEPTLKNLKNITNEQAEVIYRKRYWEPSGFDKLKDQKLALMSYDWTITSGAPVNKYKSYSITSLGNKSLLMASSVQKLSKP